VSVQNMYNLADRSAEPVLEHCEAHDIGFIPWFPLAMGELAQPGGVLAAVVEQTGAAPGQLALAWLLARSPVTLPIPGTSTVAHLDENLQAAALELTDEQVQALADAA
jgi:pyridoxine 4-dehydrogenase